MPNSQTFLPEDSIRLARQTTLIPHSLQNKSHSPWKCLGRIVQLLCRRAGARLPVGMKMTRCHQVLPKGKLSTTNRMGESNRESPPTDLPPTGYSWDQRQDGFKIFYKIVFVKIYKNSIHNMLPNVFIFFVQL